LNQTVNEILARNGNLTEADIEHIYETYLSPVRLSERIDRVNSQVMGEIEQVMTMIDAAAGSATSYKASLADATQQLGGADREGLRAIVEGLVASAREMEQYNQNLEARLTASKREIHVLQEHLEAVRHESLTDPLTTLANRKYFDEALVKAIDHAQARQQPLSLLMIDIDHFKRFNDSYGHVTGDQVLRLVALAMKQNVKGQDIATRYGGEEFVIVLPNTILRAATIVADHIRRAVMSKELRKRSTGECLGRVTISVGVSTLRNTDTPQKVLERADACLYAAKRGGRNRVTGENDPAARADGEAQVA